MPGITISHFPNNTVPYFCRMRLILPFIFLLLSTLSLSAQEDYWDVYVTQKEGKPASVLLNMSLKQASPDKGLPFIVTTGVRFSNCTVDGLPAANEFDKLYKVSDSIVVTMKGTPYHKLVGTVTHNCTRLDYYYCSDTIGLREKLSSRYMLLFPTYKYHINIRQDSAWSGYLNFLYPDEETFESMSNQKVISQLQKAGDKLVEARKINHWLFFTTEKERSSFIIYAIQKKFKIESVGKDGPLDHPFKLVISRSDKPEIYSISKLTQVLRKEANKYNGIYDGWETFVIK